MGSDRCQLHCRVSPKYILYSLLTLNLSFEVLYISVKVGTSNKDAGGQIIRVKNAYSHPKYNYSTFDYDVGLLELHSEIKAPCASPVSLPNPNTQVVEGSTGVVTGWGRKTEGGPVVNHLQVLQIRILSPKACSDVYGESTFTDRMVCAGLLKGSKDVCSGDSGGPLMVDKMLIGLVSWGYGCARPTYPSVYTNVAAFRTYITEITGT